MKTPVLYMLMCLCGLSSCSSIQTVTFEQLCPAEISFPAQIKTIAVVNNMPATPKPKSNMLTLGMQNAEGKSVAEALAKILADSKYFDQVIICDSALNEAPAHGREYRMLSGDEIRTLAEILDADAIISLDRVIVQNEKKEVIYPGMMQPWPVVLTKVTSVLNIYSPVREKALSKVVSVDSLEWDYDMAPSDKRLMEEVTHISTESLERNLVPYWNRTERVYYTGGSIEMRDAAVYVSEGNWEGAYDLWLSLYKRRKSGKMKAHAALNLALVSEMTDNFEEARQWLEEAEKYIQSGSEEEVVWKFSSTNLDKRMKDYSRLDAQMERFRNNPGK